VIPFLRGWSRSYSGDAITQYPPGGAIAGGIRYRERVRPLARTGEIVEQILTRYPVFQATAVLPTERLVTHEGEYAALVTIRGTVNGAPAQRDVGLVFGDDFYALISAIALLPERFEEMTRHVRLLARMDSHGLGVRRRRFLYTPPEGWQGLPRGAVTDWMPPDFPRHRAMMQVFPANPRAGDPAAVFEHMLADDRDAGFQVATTAGPERVASPHGLEGASWTVSGGFPDRPRTLRELIVLSCARFVYALRLETETSDPADERRRFLELARSARPIPEGVRPDPAEVASLAGHWAR
jgi:hypothetical protein